MAPPATFTTRRGDGTGFISRDTGLTVLFQTRVLSLCLTTYMCRHGEHFLSWEEAFYGYTFYG